MGIPALLTKCAIERLDVRIVGGLAGTKQQERCCHTVPATILTATAFRIALQISPLCPILVPKSPSGEFVEA